MTDILTDLENPAEFETEDENPPTETPAEIPADWVRDKDTGQMRPRKRRGRKPAATVPPTDHDPLTRTPDTAPDSAPTTRGRKSAPVPRYQKGVVAKGMATLYKRTGRIVKAMDRSIGIAIIESADDIGEAWEDLAKTNPRIRAVLMKMIVGGSWATLVMAHLPILMAVVMKERIRKHIPFGRFLDNVLEPDDDGANEVSDMFGGLTPEDMRQAMNLAQGFMGNAWAGVPVAENMPGES